MIEVQSIVKNNIGFKIASALLAFCLSATSSRAFEKLQPGQFMGTSTASLLPVGVFASDLSDYGRSDHTGSGLNANIPIITYASPYKILESQLIFSYSAPFVYQHGAQYSNPTAESRVDFRSQALGVTLVHPLGNGFSTGLSGFVRTPDAYFNNYTSADIFLGLDYVSSVVEVYTTIAYSGTFGGHAGTPYGQTAATVAALTGITGASDAVGIDFTVQKHFDKLSLGAVGFAHTDIDTRLDNSGFNVTGFNIIGGAIVPTLQRYDKRQGSIGLGGLIGYDFGFVTVQGMVTREIAKRFAYNGAQGLAGNLGYGEKETRGWLRVIVPLYLAPRPTAPVVARY